MHHVFFVCVCGILKVFLSTLGGLYFNAPPRPPLLTLTHDSRSVRGRLKRRRTDKRVRRYRSAQHRFDPAYRVAFALHAADVWKQSVGDKSEKKKRQSG